MCVHCVSLHEVRVVGVLASDIFLYKSINRLIPFLLRCKCGGFCELEHLQNVKECYCCQEIEGCVKSLRCDAVLADMNEPPSCVTLHPGFRVVCLEKWSLRQASDRYKTKAKNVYRQVGSEER